MKNFNEMVVALFVVFCWSCYAMSETLISYDDGSTYTVSENEEVYVAPKNTRLFTLQSYAKGDGYFRVQAPWAKRDYVAPVTTTGSTGSFTDVDDAGFSQACADFDTSVGFTFGYVYWDQICDINDDGEYNICDYYEPTGGATFADIQYTKQCSSSDGS